MDCGRRSVLCLAHAQAKAVESVYADQSAPDRLRRPTPAGTISCARSVTRSHAFLCGNRVRAEVERYRCRVEMLYRPALP